MMHIADRPIEIADPFARRLMAKYLERRAAEIIELRQALAAGDFQTIAQSGHNLFGSGGAYGLDEISRLGKVLEQAGNDRAADRAGEIINKLEIFIRGVVLI